MLAPICLFFRRLNKIGITERYESDERADEGKPESPSVIDLEFPETFRGEVEVDNSDGDEELNGDDGVDLLDKVLPG